VHFTCSWRYLRFVHTETLTWRSGMSVSERTALVVALTSLLGTLSNSALVDEAEAKELRAVVLAKLKELLT
jgi:hypothetical protein